MTATFETCPVCLGRGLRRRRKSMAKKQTPPRDRCVACHGDGVIGRTFHQRLDPTRTPREMAIAWATEERKASTENSGVN